MDKQPLDETSELSSKQGPFSEYYRNKADAVTPFEFDNVADPKKISCAVTLGDEENEDSVTMKVTGDVVAQKFTIDILDVSGQTVRTHVLSIPGTIATYDNQMHYICSNLLKRESPADIEKRYASPLGDKKSEISPSQVIGEVGAEQYDSTDGKQTAIFRVVHFRTDPPKYFRVQAKKQGIQNEAEEDLYALAIFPSDSSGEITSLDAVTETFGENSPYSAVDDWAHQLADGEIKVDL